MNSSWHVLYPEDRFPPAPHFLPEKTSENLAPPVCQAVSKTRCWLLQQQHEDGYWEAELEGDTILESEYLLLLAFLDELDKPEAQSLAQAILERQLPNGGWAMYPGGPVDVSGSVKAYFVLKLTGHDPSSEPMQKARQAILAHGGADAVNTFTRFYLALLGQVPYSVCPTVPPEFLLLPKWFPINLSKVSAWSRTMIVPLSVMSALKPVRELPTEFHIRELFIQAPEQWGWPSAPDATGDSTWFPWKRFFLGIDQLLKQCERWKLLPLRRTALQSAENWMLQRFEDSAGLGAIFPPMVWSLIALKALGYADDHPEMKRCREELEGLYLTKGETLRLQPCRSPVWDTAISLVALAESGVSAEYAPILHAQRWLLERQVTQPGDWSDTIDAEPGGWYFEHRNEFYPDSDDTAMVTMALLRAFDQPSDDSDSWPEIRGVLDADYETIDPATVRREIPAALARAENWMLAMQNRDGGWGAFDKDNDAEFLCHLPFADHNAMIDPSSPDLTARVLECLGQRGHRVGEPVIDKALAYLQRTQAADGSWFGRWGVNYIYGTWQVLVGLEAIGYPQEDRIVQAGAQWLLAHQQPCGGWGESADSYADPSLKGQGEATPSQTAWALLGLMAAGYQDHPAVERGIRFLLDTQNADGTWDEEPFTGTGFPQVFYLKYHYYRIYFPLMALGRWSKLTSAPEERQTIALYHGLHS